MLSRLRLLPSCLSAPSALSPSDEPTEKSTQTKVDARGGQSERGGLVEDETIERIRVIRANAREAALQREGHLDAHARARVNE